jgi:hypothetical protein
MMRFLLAMYDETAESSVREGLRALKLMREEDKYDTSFLQSSHGLTHTDDSSPPIVFSVPGSGKTQHIFDFLSHNWGHYVVSGRVPRHPKTTETLLNARQGTASLDTRHLCEMLDIINIPGEDETDIHRRAWSLLDWNRKRVLSLIREFKKVGEAGNAFDPRDWLLFQTTCTRKFDPFLRTFQIQLLLGDNSYRFRSEKGSSKEASSTNDFPRGKMYFCLDEAQCELNDDSKLTQDKSPLDGLLKMVNGWLPMGSEPYFVASGTALQLEKFQSVLERNVTNSWISAQIHPGVRNMQTVDEEIGIWQDYKAVVIDQFRVVDSDSDFDELLRSHAHRIVDKIGYLMHIGDAAQQYHLWDVFAIDSPNTTKEDFYQRLTDHLLPDLASRSKGRVKESVSGFVSKFLIDIGLGDEAKEEYLHRFQAPMRGRIRWSTLFIERLLIAYLIEQVTEGHANTMTLIKTVSDATQTTIKDQLKSRIKTLKWRNQHFLLKDLFITAVRADLMNKASIFPDTESVQMVTEGFALLKPHDEHSTSAITEQVLAESITITAVIEYLRENEASNTQKGRRTDRLERVLEQLLFDHQEKFSAIGGLAEPYLAWVSYFSTVIYSLSGYHSNPVAGIRRSSPKRQWFPCFPRKTAQLLGFNKRSESDAPKWPFKSEHVTAWRHQRLFP